MNIVHTSAAQGPQVATTSATPAQAPAPGFNDALATAQNAGPGGKTGAASDLTPVGGVPAAKAGDAGTALPSRKEKARTAESGTRDQSGVQPGVLAAALTPPPVCANLPVLPLLPDPGTTLPQAADKQAKANLVDAQSQLLPGTPSEAAAPNDVPGSSLGAAPSTRGASLPSLPIPLNTPITQASSLLPAADTKRPHPGASPSPDAEAPVALHAVSERGTAATPASLSDLLGPKKLSDSVGEAMQSVQTPDAHLLPTHHAEASGKPAAAVSGVSAVKTTMGASASSQGKTANTPENSNTGGNNPGSSNMGTPSGGDAAATGMGSPSGAPTPAFAAVEGTASPGTAALLPGVSPSPSQGAMAGNAVPLATGDAGRASTPLPSTAAAAEPTTTINTAQVLGHMNGTAMRVGLRSEEFGSISIQTSVSPGSMVAQIALDHGALGRALAVHLPAMEEKLGTALGVTARVELRDTLAQSSTQGSSSGAAGNGGSPNPGAGGSHSASSGSSSRRASEIDSGPRFAGGEVNGSTSERLSIHA